MESIKEYLSYFKDVTFEESPFNDVDNVILSSLIYLDLRKVATKPMTLHQLGKKFYNQVDMKEVKKGLIVARRTADNFEYIFNGDRYKNIIVSDYENILDDEKQFAAIKFTHDTFTYIAYEGTDESLIGWIEDFQMTYQFPIPSQTMAIKYINKTVKFKDKNVYVGGHSKGGNLAITASMYARPFIRRRIKKVFNNDGPGFLEEQLNSHAYKAILPKIVTYIPEESIIGVMFGNLSETKVIKSNGRGIFQHNLNNWNCYGPLLIKGTLNENSKMLKKRIDQWLKKHDKEKREQMVKTLFDIFNQSGITSLKQIRQFKLSSIVRLIRTSQTIDKDSKELIIDAIKTILIKEDI